MGWPVPHQAIFLYEKSLQLSDFFGFAAGTPRSVP
jgi:hypothetical protein